MKALGIITHLYVGYPVTDVCWLWICLLVVFSNYLYTEAMWFSQAIRILVMVYSVVFAYCFLHYDDFIYIALPIMMTYLLAAFYAKSLLRIGFIMVVVSNLAWIGMRMVANSIWGQELPISYRYDNDIYHFLLMFSSLIIYIAASKGYWQKPTDSM
jgi:hypothetical protein